MITASAPPSNVRKPHVPAPKAPKELLKLVTSDFVQAEYRGVERAEWREGAPVFGTKFRSEREVGFSHKFASLHANAGMDVRLTYAAQTFDDAIRAARDAALWSTDPTTGGQRTASHAVAVLQAADGAFFLTEIAFGKVSASKLGFQHTPYQQQIDGKPGEATDLKATARWTTPTSGKAGDVSKTQRNDSAPVNVGDVQDVKLVSLAANDAVKAIVDLGGMFDLRGGTVTFS